MAAPLHIKSDALRPLAVLSTVSQGGAAYYRELRGSADAFIAAGAWCAMLDEKLMSRRNWDEVLPLCHHGAVRSRAFAFFQAKMEPDYARQAAETALEPAADAAQSLMLAQLDRDDAGAAAAEGALYLATGDLTHLKNATQTAEAAAGWRAGLPWAIRMLCISPLNPASAQLMFAVLDAGSQTDLLEEVAEIFVGRNLHLQASQIFLASAAMNRGNAELCLSKLKPLDDARITGNKALAPFLGAVHALRAQAEEKLGHYKKAYDAYVALNQAERSPAHDPSFFFKGTELRGKINVPPLPADEHPNVIQMLGFPRSGTTLLENVLNAHPMIETFEEIPALNMAINRIEKAAMGELGPELPEQTFLAARKRYYDEVQSRRRKAGASVLVDKLPIRSADAAFISKLFPEWRYIFSIRHPYDVVLSCFKQRFVPNPAMENFRTIEGVVRAYDFTMTEWFKFHSRSMDEPSVHYVRYDELVTDFERVTRGVLDFAGVPWNDAVQDFAKAAEDRAAKTPSYQKVRQGLSIGVQTQWRNYGFVFQSDAVKPLRKWVEFFGYEAE